MSDAWPFVDEAFEHHIWATEKLLDACAALTPEQLESSLVGGYGTIIDTLRHTVQADSYYLTHLTDRVDEIEIDGVTVADLRAAFAGLADEWRRYLATRPDTAATIMDVDSNGYRREAKVGVRLTQVLNHGDDHRSQVSAALTNLGVEPPGISGWDFGYVTGRARDLPPA